MTGVWHAVRLGLAAVSLCLLAACSTFDLPEGSYGSSSTSGGVQLAQARPGIAIVQRGDTVTRIAQRHGIPVRDLIDANNLRPPYTVYPGQELRLPAPTSYTVRRGDSLSQIAVRLNVPMSALAAQNGLKPPYTIHPGQVLKVPRSGGGTTQVASAAPSAPRQSATGQKPAGSAPASSGSGSAGKPAPVRTATAGASGPAIQPVKAAAPLPPRSGRTFAWPVTGRILSGFGPKEGGLHNDGINIAAREGDPVRAAEAGVVVYSGNELAGFGNLLLVRHADGWVTAYAHNSALLAKRGETVNRGQIIARAGRTGNVTSPQLHFEIRQGKQAVNPLNHLPPMTSVVASRSG